MNISKIKSDLFDIDMKFIREVMSRLSPDYNPATQHMSNQWAELHINRVLHFTWLTIASEIKERELNVRNFRD